MDGKLLRTLKGDAIVAEFIEILNDYVDRRYKASEETAVGAGSIS
jgi:(E)-4-hydroxy-3-methylbut-2-enyl-diphosphate synthase